MSSIIFASWWSRIIFWLSTRARKLRPLSSGEDLYGKTGRGGVSWPCSAFFSSSLSLSDMLTMGTSVADHQGNKSIRLQSRWQNESPSTYFWQVSLSGILSRILSSKRGSLVRDRIVTEYCGSMSKSSGISYYKKNTPGASLERPVHLLTIFSRNWMACIASYRPDCQKTNRIINSIIIDGIKKTVNQLNHLSQPFAVEF